LILDSIKERDYEYLADAGVANEEEFEEIIVFTCVHDGGRVRRRWEGQGVGKMASDRNPASLLLKGHGDVA
jgi:hypothetical protein